MSGSEEEVTVDASPHPPKDTHKQDPHVGFSAKKNPPKNDTQKSIPKTHNAAFSININNASGIHIGNNIVLNYNTNTEKNKFKDKDAINKKDFESLFADNRRITTDDISVVAKHINENWKEVGKQLSYTEAELSQFKENHGHLNIYEVIFRMLLDWMRAKPSEATVSRLSNVLFNCEQVDALSQWLNNR